MTPSHESKAGCVSYMDVGANKFRNSYISYRVAVTQDVHRVSLESGNSPKVILKEYLELATEEDGKKWFGIMPSEPLQTRRGQSARGRFETIFQAIEFYLPSHCSYMQVNHHQGLKMRF
ncbi:MAG: hypothetical protein JWM16_5380 [Verrucomicrobiales bacterium]|nr:hypothetical protein [Verrucomicrobiales bacterium]